MNRSKSVPQDMVEARERRYALVMVYVPAMGAVAALVQLATIGVEWWEWGLLIAMYLLSGFGVEVGLHRFFSHHAFRAGSVLTAALGIAGSMAAQGPVLFWASVHRRHHAFTDQAGDPHTPWQHGLDRRGRWRGFVHAHLGWMFTPPPPGTRQFVRELMRDRMVLWVHKHYLVWVALGLVIPAVAGACVAEGWAGALRGLLWGGLVRVFLVAQSTAAINSFAHTFGRRPSSTRDHSRNLWWLALLTLGGGWHNNHHAHPGSARTGHAWWQLDPSGRLIEWFERLGWVSHVRRPQVDLAAQACPAVKTVQD